MITWGFKKCFDTEFHGTSQTVLELTMLPTYPNSQSSYLGLQSAAIIDVYHHSWPAYFKKQQ